MELSKLQEEILNKEDKKIVIIASSASGKTHTATEKLRRTLRAGIEPSKIVAITFTNLAAEEMRARLGNDYKNGTFIGTIHSYANYLLTSSGINTSSILDNEKFDDLFKLIKKNRHCIKPVDFLMLDEAQDSSADQFEFIFDMIQPDSFFVVGDPKQSIYSFKDGDPTLMQNLANREDVACYSLNENYRNGWQILNFARRIIEKTGLYDDSVPVRKEPGRIYEVENNPMSIVRTIKNWGDYKNWAIIARSNAQVDNYIDILKMHGVPCDSFKQGDLNRVELQKKMSEDTVKVLTIHASKGLQWDNVVVVGARFYPDEERNVAYVAATRARNVLVWAANAKKKPLKKVPTLQDKVVSWE